ncbi:tyrosine-type recombinase/integrase [Kribbella turkmenica]|uniref:tyrosine-type recombinase/integrase n=1 Tax=Kribbella turkmenica TaxID=2530375 RepID=UPI00389968CC
MFTTTIGTPIEPRNVNRHFDALCAKSGVRRIRFHDLRHSCASLLWSQDVPLEQIQDILGHADPRTTKVIYVDVAEELQRDVVDKLGSLSRTRRGDVGVNREGHEEGEHHSRPICRSIRNTKPRSDGLNLGFHEARSEVLWFRTSEWGVSSHRNRCGGGMFRGCRSGGW